MLFAFLSIFVGMYIYEEVCHEPTEEELLIEKENERRFYRNKHKDSYKEVISGYNRD